MRRCSLRTRTRPAALTHPAFQQTAPPTRAPSISGHSRTRPVRQSRVGEDSRCANEGVPRIADDEPVGHERLPARVRYRRRCNNRAGDAADRVARPESWLHLPRTGAGRTCRGWIPPSCNAPHHHKAYGREHRTRVKRKRPEQGTPGRPGSSPPPELPQPNVCCWFKQFNRCFARRCPTEGRFRS